MCGPSRPFRLRGPAEKLKAIGEGVRGAKPIRGAGEASEWAAFGHAKAVRTLLYTY
jgi:hypothetical protein